MNKYGYGSKPWYPNVNIKIDGIYGCESPPKYGTIGFDPWPYRYIIWINMNNDSNETTDSNETHWFIYMAISIHSGSSWIHWWIVIICDHDWSWSVESGFNDD